MTEPRIVTRDEWLVERVELLAREKELTRAGDRTTDARRALPWVPVEEQYEFQTPDGSATLADLFGSASQLVVYHFMFGADWEQGCPSCSFWADNFNGIESHLAARDIAFTAISRAPIEKLQLFKKRMGWSFPWVSSFGSSFNEDFNVAFGDAHEPDDPVTYNFGTTRYPSDEAHGLSVFAMNGAGAVFHTYSAYGRGVEATNGAYAFMDLTPKGRDEVDGPMRWLRHHDRYEAAS